MDVPAGLAAAFVLYGLNSLALKILEGSIKARYPQSQIPAYPGLGEYWAQEVVRRTPGGWLLGMLEMLIFYASLHFQMWPLAASYIALKVASKWKSWTTTWEALATIKPRNNKAKLDSVRAHLARAALDHRL